MPTSNVKSVKTARPGHIEEAAGETLQPSAAKRQLGRLAGQYSVPEDFDAPLPDEVLDLFEGR